MSDQCTLCGSEAECAQLHRDGSGIGPLVPVCLDCMRLPAEQLQARLTTFVSVGSVALDRLRLLPDLGACDVKCRRAALWLVVLSDAWLRASAFSQLTRVSLPVLVRRVSTRTDIQQVLCALYRVQASGTAMLGVVLEMLEEE